MVLIACLIPAVMNAQAFMRYHMKDGSYNGFYTNCIDSIKHKKQKGNTESLIYTSDSCYHILISDINNITFEKASIEQNKINGYRIYNIVRPDESFKRIYADNRSISMLSRTGEFAANDTIVLKSAYNQLNLIICTNEEGEIIRLFNNEQIYFIDYETTEDAYIFNEETNGFSIKMTSKVQTKEENIFFQHLQEILKALYEKDSQFKTWSSMAQQHIEFFLHALNEIQTNQDLENAIIITEPTFQEDDEASVMASIEGIQGSPGHDAFILYVITVIKKGDEATKKIENKKSKQAEIYKRYYGRKYDINVSALPPNPEDVTTKTAILQGELHTTEIKRRGKAYFLLSSEKNDKKELTATEEQTDLEIFHLIANATGLTHNTRYNYSVIYKCNIYGLEFAYTSEDESFQTNIDLSGTWTLNIDGNEKARTLTLTEGGSVIETEDVDESFNGGSWVVQGNECTIRKMAVFGNTYVTFVLEGTFEGDNPTTITGSKYNENVNSVTGIPHKTNPIPFIMTK